MVDILDLRDIAQVIAGAGFPAMLIFATNTVVTTSVELSIMLLFVVMGLTGAGVFAAFGGDIFLIIRHILVGFATAFFISVILLILWRGIPIDQVLSVAYFTTEGFIAFLLGGFTGSLTDAARS